MQGAPSYHDYLPASHHTPGGGLEPPKMTNDFLRQELGVGRLNDIHNWLWLVGRPMPPRPLHYQKAAQRGIVVHEQMDLHLIWDNKRMFLKPIPRYLLDQKFWQDNLNCDGKSTSASKDTSEALICERCQIHKCAIGFMLSYASLIRYESDLYIAKEENLVPAEVNWPEWKFIVKELLTPETSATSMSATSTVNLDWTD